MSSCSRTTLLLLFVMTTAAITTLCFATSPHIDEGPVCGLDHQTYESYETAQAANVNVMHCGNCGACSNALDIQIYRETKKHAHGKSQTMRHPESAFRKTCRYQVHDSIRRLYGQLSRLLDAKHCLYPKALHHHLFKIHALRKRGVP